MLYRGINAVCSANRTKHINTLCGQNVEFFRSVHKIAKKATISFVMSVRPSVCPHEQLGSHRTDIHEILCLIIFRKAVKKIPVSLISDRNIGYFTGRTADIHTCIHTHIHIHIHTYVGHLESKERLRIQPAQLFHFS